MIIVVILHVLGFFSCENLRSDRIKQKRESIGSAVGISIDGFDEVYN